MGRQFVYFMSSLNKRYPNGKTTLKNVNLSFYPNAKIGIIGTNGAGKSTIMRIMAGIDKEFEGEAWLAEGVTVGYLPQEPSLDNKLSVLENVRKALEEDFNTINLYNDLMMNYDPEKADEIGKLQDIMDSKDLWNIDNDITIAMQALGCPPEDNMPENLSGGEIRRVAICKLLLQQPDILLLDEPTNHLDAATVSWLENHLKEYPGAVLIVTHDRYFLDSITQWILEIDNGECVPFKGNYHSWLGEKQKQLEQGKKSNLVLQRNLKKEYDWLTSSPQARRGKSKARIRAYDDLFKESNTHVNNSPTIIIPNGPKLGKKVIELTKVCKSYSNKTLIKELSFKMPPGSIVGVIGPNGAGKSTLFKMITDNIKADSGQITVGETVQIGYAEQSREKLSSNKTVWDEISDGQELIKLNNLEMNSRAYVSAFGFKGAQQQRLVNTLSGGERNRIQLAKVLKTGANLLLLDEPTNDLDTETLSALESALEEFAGSALIISHDRFFLDRVSTHILSFEENGNIEWFEGNFAEYEAYRINKYGEKNNKTNSKFTRQQKRK